MLQIVPAESAAQYQQVRELSAELTEWDMSRVDQLGLDAQKVLDFYFSRRPKERSQVWASLYLASRSTPITRVVCRPRALRIGWLMPTDSLRELVAVAQRSPPKAPSPSGHVTCCIFHSALRR
jgi:hypothetical protein